MLIKEMTHVVEGGLVTVSLCGKGKLFFMVELEENARPFSEKQLTTHTNDLQDVMRSAKHNFIESEGQ